MLWINHQACSLIGFIFKGHTNYISVEKIRELTLYLHDSKGNTVYCEILLPVEYFVIDIILIAAS